MLRRRRAREVALQVLYEDDLNPHIAPSVGEQFVRRRLRDPRLVAFALNLIAGVRRHAAELDRLIEQTAANWSLARMAVVDRNILRLGAYEMLYGHTPDRVVLDEAIELAKRYGTSHSAQFVNGILDRLLHKYAEKGEDSGASGAATPACPPSEAPSG